MATLSLKVIRTDGGTQTRAAIQPDAVKDYADAIEAGETLPPVTVYHDGSDYWLADGFHRLDAYRKLEAREIDADVRQGTRRDAVLHSVGANATHGLRRTTEDKRRAVTVLLNDAEWSKWSDREIARRAGVSPSTVGALRPKSSVQLGQMERKVKRGDSEYIMQPAKPKPSEPLPPRYIKTYSPPPLPDPEPEPLEPTFTFPDDTPQEVLEAAAKPLPTSTPYHDLNDALKEARADEVDKIGAHLSGLLRAKDLHELVHSPLGVMHGLPNMWRLVQLEMQKGKPDEPKTITLN